MYVAASNNSFPVLQKVLVAFGDRIAFEDRLSDALDTLFGPGAGTSAPDQNAPPTTPGAPTSPSGPTSSPTNPPGSPTSPPPGGSGAGGSVGAALTDVDSAVSELQSAYRSGDFTRIGQALTNLQKAVDAYEKARSSSPASPTSPPG